MTGYYVVITVAQLPWSSYPTLCRKNSLWPTIGDAFHEFHAFVFAIRAVGARTWTHFNRCFSCCDGYLVRQKTCSIGRKWDRPVKLLVTDLGFTVHLFREYRMIVPVRNAAGAWVWPVLNPVPRSKCIYLPLYASRRVFQRRGKFNLLAPELFF